MFQATFLIFIYLRFYFVKYFYLVIYILKLRLILKPSLNVYICDELFKLKKSVKSQNDHFIIFIRVQWQIHEQLFQVSRSGQSQCYTTHYLFHAKFLIFLYFNIYLQDTLFTLLNTLYCAIFIGLSLYHFMLPIYTVHITLTNYLLFKF